MHCLICDKLLSDREAIRKDAQGGFIDLCDGCFCDDSGVDNESIYWEGTMPEMSENGERPWEG